MLFGIYEKLTKYASKLNPLDRVSGYYTGLFEQKETWC